MIRSLSLCVLLVTAARAASAQDTPPRPPHPEPRVIVSVLSLAGPHERGEVERHARLAWGKIVRCYKAIDRSARGSVTVELAVHGSGTSSGARRLGATLESRELSGCLTRILNGLKMPKARRTSFAKIEIRVAPGDPS
ncbi:MAG: hypothetical protein M3020_00480 [Myxococcota bacterium]|nr:hypothetical protein [Myxococcota bacterium]